MTMLLLLQALLANTPIFKPEPILSDLKIVGDAGHGGESSGFRIEYRVEGKRRWLYEKVHTCDSMARLKLYLETYSGLVQTTTYGPCLKKPREELPTRLVDIGKKEYFSTTGGVVTGDDAGLLERVIFADRARWSTNRHTIFVSLHYDNSPERWRHGAFIMVPRGRKNSLLAKSIAHELEQAGIAQTYCKEPTIIIESGTCKLKRVLILEKAVLDETVLVELGNVTNAEDRKCITSAACRQSRVEAVARGILRYERERKALALAGY